MTDTLFDIKATACPVKSKDKPHVGHDVMFLVVGRWQGSYTSIPKRLYGRLPVHSPEDAVKLAEECREDGWHSLEIVTIPATRDQEAKP